MGNVNSGFGALSNEELVRLSQNGNLDARSVLCARFLNTANAPLSVSYLDFDDFVQEGMLGFLRAVDTYDFSKGVPFEAYAFRCMQNSVRSAMGHTKNDIKVDSQADYYEVADNDKDPLGQLLDAEKLTEVLDACETSLSDVEKTVVFFRAGGMAYEEIAKRLGLTAKAVDSALHRARKKLKNVCSD